MKSRRSFLAAVPVAATAAVSGCLGFVTGDEPLTFEATKAVPSASALSETGYEEQEAGWQTENESFEALGVEREIEITFWTAAYTKGVQLQGQETEGAAFAVASLPAAEFFGEARNPIANMDNRELLEEVTRNVDGNYADVRDIEHEETKPLRILGESRDLDTFSAVTDIAGQEVDLLLHLASVEDGDDIVVLLGGHPQLLPDEELNIEDLMTSVTH